MVVEPDQMNEHQLTDVLHAPDFPFITLTESKMHNIWYHDEADLLFYLTDSGFRVTIGSKKVLFDHGYGRTNPN